MPAGWASAPRRIVANLPYNVATPLLLAWLAQAERFERLVLMFQREVAERLIAKPRSKDYGRLSIATQWRCQARRLFDIPPRAFTPPPKVTSSLVELIPRPSPLAPADPALLERVTAAAFGQRRKMLRQSLRSADPRSRGAAGRGRHRRDQARRGTVDRGIRRRSPRALGNLKPAPLSRREGP